MEHKLNPDLETIDWKQVAGLIWEIGWSDRDPEDLRSAFAKSSFTIFVFEKDKLIAFGRTVDDGKYYAQLADIVVHPDYQNKGIGELVVKSLTDQLADFHFVTLTSATEKADMFYRNLGWKKQSTAFIWPLSEKQIRLHCEPGE